MNSYSPIDIAGDYICEYKDCQKEAKYYYDLPVDYEMRCEIHKESE